MSSPPVPRPFEEEALFNPAFLSLLLRESAAQFGERSGGRALPAVLAYLITPLALHGPTRQALPTNVTAQMGEWVRAHPNVLVDLPTRARSLRPLVSIAACFGLRHGVLDSEDGALRAGNVKRRPVAWLGAVTSIIASRELGSSDAGSPSRRTQRRPSRYGDYEPDANRRADPLQPRE